MPQPTFAGVPGKWVAIAASGAAALAVLVTLRADFLAYPGWLAAQKADIILGPVLVGLYWLRRRPASRLGPLLIGAGLVAGVPYVLQSSSAPVLFAGGILWEAVIYASALALILSFPSGRLDGRAERLIFAIGVTVVSGTYLTMVLLSPQIASQSAISACASACPANGLLVASEPALVIDVLRAGRVTVILVALAAVGLIVWRVMSGTPPRRRALVLGAPVAIAFLLSQAAYQTARLLEIQADAVYPLLQWTLAVTRSSVWYGFLLALIAAELTAGRVLRRVVIESLRRPAVRELETMLRKPLGDPGLRLAFRQPDTDAWVDADGEPIAVPDPASGHLLTEVERDGQAAAAIVHDAQLAEEPELLPALRAVGRRGPRTIAVTGRRIGRYPPEIESAVYYCCLEAVQNATKHAGPAAHITARLTAGNGELRLEVRDDGPGFDVAAIHTGVGLRNMEDRLGAVHGHLAIVSSPGNGTVISGVVPINGAVP
jgi:Histidine kinase-, DNA gyrase B-, and HSP90-like ATPase